MEKKLKKLITKVQKKADRNAADEIISHFYREIYGYVYKQTLNKELSMDLTQEIFMNMLTSIEHYDEKKASFRTWLYKIATYKVVDYFRSKNYRYEQLSQVIEDDLEDETDFTITIEAKLQAEKINGFINQLDTHRQQIIRLKIYGEYSFIEIANLLKIPESTVKTKYYGTLKIIRNYFKEKGGIKR